MTSKQKADRKVSKKQLVKKPTPKKKVNKSACAGNAKATEEDTIEIETLGRSTIVDADIKRSKRRLRLEKPPANEIKKGPDMFYRRFVFRCKKCMEEFKHTHDITPRQYEVTCPKCDENHALEITLTSGYYDIIFPETIEILRSKWKRDEKETKKDNA